MSPDQPVHGLGWPQAVCFWRREWNGSGQAEK